MLSDTDRSWALRTLVALLCFLRSDELVVFVMVAAIFMAQRFCVGLYCCSIFLPVLDCYTHRGASSALLRVTDFSHWDVTLPASATLVDGPERLFLFPKLVSLPTPEWLMRLRARPVVSFSPDSVYFVL